MQLFLTQGVPLSLEFSNSIEKRDVSNIYLVFIDSRLQVLHSAAHKSFTLSLVVSTACVTEVSAESAEAGVPQNRGLSAAGTQTAGEKK